MQHPDSSERRKIECDRKTKMEKKVINTGTSYLVIDDLEAEYQSKIRELNLANSITQVINKTFNLEEIFNITLDKFIEIEFVDKACIYLVDEAENEALLQGYRNFNDDCVQLCRKIPYGQGLTWEVIESGKITNFTKPQLKSREAHDVDDLESRNMLGIPVTVLERAIGVIWLISKHKHTFTKIEESLLSSLGSQIALAIGKAFLYRQLSKKNRYQSVISNVTQNVHSSIDVQEVVDNAIDSLYNNIENVSSISIYIVEHDVAVLRSQKGYPNWLVEQIKQIPCPKGFTWKTIIEEKPRYCPDVDVDPDVIPSGMEVGTKSFVSMPITIEGQCIGVININSSLVNVFDSEELRLLGVVANQIEVALSHARQAEALKTAQKELERRVQNRTRELSRTVNLLEAEIKERKNAEEVIQASLDEKNVLLKEIHHRVKNNLQIICSLISLQSGNIKDPIALDMCLDSQLRIKSMALIHESLYQSENLALINFSEYINNLVDNLIMSYNEQSKPITTKIKANNIELGIDSAMPCGLIINELVSNCLKHAFPTPPRGDRAGSYTNEINIELKTEDDLYILTVKDNGCGLPAELDFRNTETLGLRLVCSLAKQLSGQVSVDRSNGTTFNITFYDTLRLST